MDLLLAPLFLTGGFAKQLIFHLICQILEQEYRK